jgi:beta-aspartyl-dipeptidase (metallo-type)
VIVVLRDAELFAPEPLGRRDILIADGRIAKVAARLPPLPKDIAEDIDLGGKTVIPGLIDAHVHVTGGGGEAGPETRVFPLASSVFTSAGVTSVIGLLGTDGTTRTIASLVARTLGLRREGVSAWCYTGSYELPLQTLTGSVRKDIVFIDPIVGVGELAISDHRSSQPTLDELLRVASDAHVAGMMSDKAGVLHLHLGDGPRGLDLVRRALDVSEIPARVFHPTHVNRQKRLFDEALALSERGVTLDITAFPPETGDDPGLSAADAIDRYLGSVCDKERVTCSSDGGGCLPTFDGDGQMVSMDVGRPTTLLETVRELTRRGRGLGDVLPAFTSNVAKQFRLRGKGHLQEGADADLVVLGQGLLCERVMTRGVWRAAS